MKRVLITGMGGELGTRVATMLEHRPDVAEVSGVDTDPPRSRLHSADFHRIDPRDRKRLVDFVRSFEPTVLLHLAVYEPNARFQPRSAHERTVAMAIAVLGAAAHCPSLEHIVLRSGTEVYGRRRGMPTRPDETVPPEPTTPFGRSLLHAERLAAHASEVAGAPLTTLRLAPIVGPHVPSPLGRYLRLPVVPVGALSELPFAVCHQEDAADAIVAAVTARHDGPLNVAGDGAVTASQAARIGGRIPLPMMGPAWRAARVGAELLGAPLPDHVHELLVRGRVAECTQAAEVLGTRPAWSTPDVVKDLYDWAPVTYVRVAHDEEAA